MDKLPRHIAIIMDGNGRWAQRRNHGRAFGHTKGVQRTREITKECAKIGIEAITLYAFSTENWQRPAVEVNFLMKLLLRYMKHEAQELIDNNLRFRAVGFTHMLPEKVRLELERVQESTKKNTGMYINIAISYGSRQEITAACKNLAIAVAEGKIKPDEISEELISKQLFTHESPEPDLMIRTGGDQRISNFLLWQLAYAELYFTEKCWPDFGVTDLHEAIEAYHTRDRRYGKVKDVNA